MKHFTFASVFTILVCSAAAQAAEIVEVPWTELCSASKGQSIVVTTTDGATKDGSCTSTANAGELTLTKDQHDIKIARADISRIQLQRPRRTQFLEIWKGSAHSLQEGVDLLFSPLAPVGAVMIPATLAWRVVASPFCLIADAAARMPGEEREIRVKVQ